MAKMMCPMKKMEIDVPKDCPKECKYLKEGKCTHPDMKM